MTVYLQLKGKTHKLTLENLKKQLEFKQKLKTRRNRKNYLRLTAEFEPILLIPTNQYIIQETARSFSSITPKITQNDWMLSNCIGN